MAGSIANNTAVYKKFQYIAPTSPNRLIDPSTFTIDFASRKFINIGLDPTDQFNVTAHIISPSRHVTISADFMRRIFALMDNILSYILDTPVRYKRITFLETDCMRMSSMVYQGESVLVIENTNQDGCRVLLNRVDLINIQYMEWTIFESIVRKSEIIRPNVMQQFDDICEYIKSNYHQEQHVDDMATTIRKLNNYVKRLLLLIYLI